MGASAKGFDIRAFRNALGTFATGVTVVTTRGADGRPWGLTVNSFNAVSLDPPLVLWSIDQAASIFPVFETAEWYAVHVLTADQQPLSEQFYQRTAETRFDGLDVDEGLAGLPLLRACAACFECRVVARHPGGDHVILVGQVERFQAASAAPLIFHGGRFQFLSNNGEG